MRTRLSFFPVILAAVAVGSSSCVIRPGPGSSPGDVTFLWSFGTGQYGCAVLTEVDHVTVDIPGQVLQNNGVYGCTNSGTAGITLLDFRPGTYTYRIQGRSRNDSVLYEGSGSFVVNGLVTVQANLLPTAVPGDVYLTWRLPEGRGCGSTPAVSAVRVRIDQGTPFEIPCAEGQTQTGALVTALAGGDHQIDLAARDANDFYYYRKASTLTVFPGASSSQDYQLEWAVGGLPVQWIFASGPAWLTCAQAGVNSVFVNLVDPDHHFVYPEPGVEVPCTTGGFPGTDFTWLYPGTYEILFQARGTSNVLYSTNQQVMPTATVVAGVFPPLNDAAPQFVLAR